MISIFLKGFSFVQRFFNVAKVLIFGSKGKILVYHEIGEQNTYGVESSSFCTICNFKRILEKYHDFFCSLDEFLKDECRKKIVLTFDDVPESFYLNAYPLLKDRKIPFVIYVCPNLINKKGFLTKEQLEELSRDSLCTIGAHTMNHTKLRYEENSYSDMLDSKFFLERISSYPVKHLAYPFGRITSVSRKVILEAKKAGFESAVSTIPTEVPLLYNKWFIPRLVEN